LGILAQFREFLVNICGNPASVPPNTEVELSLCFLLRGQKGTIH